MCGIAGFLADFDPSRSRERLDRMIGTLAHRGPDGTGQRIEPGVGLAHARLSIIDIAGGAQPIHNQRGTVWTVFNGEIFNYLELRAELERDGHRFYTQSDTEVIVHLYDRHGDRFVEHLNGQFAIALWDGERRRLLLARDRAGIRPLYHARTRDGFWFASEIKALLAVAPELARLDLHGVAQALSFWAPLDPQTAFSGVRSLPPGHCLAIEADGREHAWRYWDWDFPDAGTPPPFASIDAATDALRSLLVDAVRLQLRADVPVGAYLSGGLDSSGIVALVRHFTSVPMQTFSIAFDDPEFDESAHQLEMARHLGTDHSMLRVSRRDIGEAFPRFVLHAEAPVPRTAPVPLMLLSGEVRRSGLKVVLTGEGADEVFGGYDLFKEAKVRRFWARQPQSRLRPLLLGRLYGWLDHSPVANPALARSFFGQGMEHIERPVFAHVPRWTTSQRALAFLSEDARAQLGPWSALDECEHHLPSRIAQWTPLARDQYVEAKTLMAGYLLSAQGDRVAMANSIEGRFPYLDHRLIEFANRLPPQWKIRGLTEKHILRRALAGLLPESIRTRTKQPYRAPDAASFFDDGQPLDWVADLFAPEHVRASGLFDADAVGRLLAKCRAGRAPGFADNQALVGIASTLLLERQFVHGNATSPSLP